MSYVSSNRFSRRHVNCVGNSQQPTHRHPMWAAWRPSESRSPVAAEEMPSVDFCSLPILPQANAHCFYGSPMITPWASNLHQNFLLRTGIRPVLAKSCDKLVHMTQSICAIATMAAAMRYGLVHQTASFKAWKVSSTASRFLAADMSISRKPRINCRKSWEYIRINIKKREHQGTKNTYNQI